MHLTENWDANTGPDTVLAANPQALSISPDLALTTMKPAHWLNLAASLTAIRALNTLAFAVFSFVMTKLF